MSAIDASKNSHQARVIERGTCPQCGRKTVKPTTGRPPIWCSQKCRRAAYEERRAAATGAIAVEVVETVEIHEHPIGTCVDRTMASPAGCRRVIHELARLAREGTLSSAPQWESTYLAVHGGLLDAIYARTTGRA